MLLECPRSQPRKGVKAVIKLSLRSEFSETMCEQIGVVEVPKISSRECVEAVKLFLQERISERMSEQIGVVEVPKISSREGVEAVKTVLSRANFRKDVQTNWD